MSMQMDAEFKKEQIGTLFCRGGALEGELGGGGCPPQKVHVLSPPPKKTPALNTKKI